MYTVLKNAWVQVEKIVRIDHRPRLVELETKLGKLLCEGQPDLHTVMETNVSNGCTIYIRMLGDGRVYYMAMYDNQATPYAQGLSVIKCPMLELVPY